MMQPWSHSEFEAPPLALSNPSDKQSKMSTSASPFWGCNKLWAMLAAFPTALAASCNCRHGKEMLGKYMQWNLWINMWIDMSWLVGSMQDTLPTTIIIIIIIIIIISQKLFCAKAQTPRLSCQCIAGWSCASQGQKPVAATTDGISGNFLGQKRFSPCSDFPEHHRRHWMEASKRFSLRTSVHLVVDKSEKIGTYHCIIYNKKCTPFKG